MQTLIMLFIYVMSGYTVLQAVRSPLAARWPKAKGEIISSELDTYYGNGMTYQPVIEFMYVVRDKEYRSNKIAIGYSGVSIKSISTSIVNKYYANKHVDISYNPKKPGYGVLITGVRLFHLVNIGFAGATLLVLHLFVINQ